ncbi:ralBP1-associated Eps domain-containing protein 2-like isoform X2 [Brienomyrus brachyistius]|uniref:ralBP1-associated Eps domain-containing protein 2-like isoform X2 n=1 Tax=Brienomyrus brachyistius TaxID=42636 RepID=UPI0020B1E501|nr:ralBP1-associated Eps domain-containing protein 2-like isoform X2 [Brienomyrus brachyistius]
MEQSHGASVERGFISLSESEQRCYSGLCSLCQADSSGKLQASRVAELLRASQLPVETLHQVTEICGAKHLGHFSVGQFHVALKLLAAAQAGLPVRLESIKGELPLPRFPGLVQNTEGWYQGLPQYGDIKPHQFGASSGQIHTTAIDRSRIRHPENNMDIQEPQAPPRSPRNSPPSSPASSSHSTCSTQRNDDALVAQAKQGSRLPGVQQESCSPKHHAVRVSAEQGTLTKALSVEALIDHNSEDCSDDPWRITEEQREYYTRQFKSLQPDLGALILGSVAKDFFTKSRLSIRELSHIWDLSDLDHDGALTFPEFCIAFHLIVARKNGFPVPEILPPGLQSSLLEQDGVPPRPMGEGIFFGAHLTQLEKIPVSPERTEPLISFEETKTKQNRVETLGPRAEMTASKFDVKQEPSKSASSPKRASGVQDQSNELADTDISRPEPACKMDSVMRPRSRPRSYSSTSINDSVKNSETPPAPPPRRQKTHSRASSLDLNKLLQQSHQEPGGDWLLPPPALPPRRVAMQVQHVLPSAGKSSQKALQQVNFADFTKFRAEEKSPIKSSGQRPLCKSDKAEDMVHTKTDTGSSLQLPQKSTHKKYRHASQSLDPAQPLTASTTGTRQAQKLPNRQKKDIQTAIRKNKETNAVLARINSELQQKLKEVHQERISLEAQLETLRPIAFV